MIRTVVLDNGGLRRNSQNTNTNNKLIRTKGVDNSKLNIAQHFLFLGMCASYELPTQACARTRGMDVEREQAKDKECTVAFKCLV